MKIRILTLGFAAATSLFGQYNRAHRFSWQEACFKNPALPYCSGREFAVKHRGQPKDAATATVLSPTRDDYVVDGIDWRFADPDADWLAGLNFSELRPSPLARKLIAQLGAKHGLSESDVHKILAGLAGIRRVAVSFHDESIVMMITVSTGAAPVPMLEESWKALPLSGNALLIGHSKAVDHAAARMSAPAPLSDLTILAVDRQGDSEFWMAGNGRIAGSVSASAKQFVLAVAVQERLTCDTLFEFTAAPDEGALRAWPVVFGKPSVEGTFVHSRTTMDASEVQQRFGDIASGFLGERLGALLSAARHLPARDPNVTGHARPVIQGLDAGPRELKDQLR